MGAALALCCGVIIGLLVLALASGVTNTDPYHNQGPLIFLVKDIQKPTVVKLEWQDRALQIGSSALITADWLTTVDGIRKGYSETNPILGRHPSLGRANLLIATGLLTNAFIVPRIKDKELRRGIWLTMLILETKALHGNHRAGLRLNFRL